MRILLLILALLITLNASEKFINYQERFNIKIDALYNLVGVQRIMSNIEVTYAIKDKNETISFNSMGGYSEDKISKKDFFSCINKENKCFDKFSVSFSLIEEKIDFIKKEDLELYIFKGNDNIYLVYVFIKNNLEGSIVYESSYNQKLAIENIKTILETIEVKPYNHFDLDELINKFEDSKKNENYNKASSILIQALIIYKDSNKIRNIAKEYFKYLFDKKLIAVEYFEYGN